MIEPVEKRFPKTVEITVTFNDDSQRQLTSKLSNDIWPIELKTCLRMFEDIIIKKIKGEYYD